MYEHIRVPLPPVEMSTKYKKNIMIDKKILHSKWLFIWTYVISVSYCMVCASVLEDNPRAFASGL